MISLSSATAHQERDERTDECLAMAAAASGKGQRQRLIDEAILINLGMADNMARQYKQRGIPVDDLIQVARLGLVAAAHRYDPSSGHSFTAYAAPTIRGELRKYFRDTGWAIRPPRRIQETHLKIRRVLPELTQHLGHAPTAEELAERLGCEEDLVKQAQLAGDGYRNLSLDHEAGTDDSSEATTLADVIGGPDPEFGRAEARILLASAIQALGERERLVLELRFVDGLTQREVGDRIGVSQMQVSRILNDILTTLRRDLGVTAEATTAA